MHELMSAVEIYGLNLLFHTKLKTAESAEIADNERVEKFEVPKRKFGET
jgi:hypothetical protein